MSPRKPVPDPATATPPSIDLSRSKPDGFRLPAPFSSDEEAGSARPIPSPDSAPNDHLPRPGDDPMPGPEMLAGPLDETEALRKQLLQAQRLSSVGALASSVAHEFNNILTTIINYAKLGLKGAADPTQKQAFEKILKGGQRAATIVSGMLGFARNQSNRREDVDLVRLVEEVLLLTEKDRKSVV